MRDVMIDLETMGVGPSAAIVSIGAVIFDPETGELGAEFYRVVSLSSSMSAGGVVDAGTIMWWLEQSDAARNAVSAKFAEGIEDVLFEFDDFVQTFAGGCNIARVWGNGAAFDNVILRGAYDRLHMDRPWEFYNDRCYRTVKAMHPEIKMLRTGTHHNALDDAISQAKHLCAMLKSPTGECPNEEG